MSSDIQGACRIFVRRRWRRAIFCFGERSDSIKTQCRLFGGRIPHLARHSRTLDGEPIPEYLEKSNTRFGQWILDTCLRPYDQDWINYQQEIALRHTAVKKNAVDGVRSTPYVPWET